LTDNGYLDIYSTDSDSSQVSGSYSESEDL